MIAIENYYSLVTAKGRDCLDYVNRMMTIDIEKMAVNTASLGAQLAANGRVIAPILFYRTEHSLGMLLHPDLSQAVVDELNRFRFRSDVTFTLHDDVCFYTPDHRESSPSSQGASSYTIAVSSTAQGHRLEFPDGRVLLVCSETSAQQAPSSDIWQVQDIEHGICWFGSDSSNRYIAQMIGLDSLGAVDFRKGCFPGQEVVARIRYKGRVKRHLFRCRAQSTLNVGDKLVQDESALGEVVTCCKTEDGSVALAVLSESVQQDKPIFVRSDDQIPVSVSSAFDNS